MTSKAQLEANKRYRRKLRQTGRLKFIQVEFREGEMDLYDHAKANAPTMTYIKDLIRKDMK